MGANFPFIVPPGPPVAPPAQYAPGASEGLAGIATVLQGIEQARSNQYQQNRMNLILKLQGASQRVKILTSQLQALASVPQTPQVKMQAQSVLANLQGATDEYDAVAKEYSSYPDIPKGADKTTKEHHKSLGDALLNILTHPSVKYGQSSQAASPPLKAPTTPSVAAPPMTAQRVASAAPPPALPRGAAPFTLPASASNAPILPFNDMPRGPA